MLKSITLKMTEGDPLVLPAGGVTVIVGPNNSGKSLLLRELETQIEGNPPPSAPTRIFHDFDVKWPDEKRFAEHIQHLQEPSARIGTLGEGGAFSFGGFRGSSRKAHVSTPERLLKAIRNKDKNAFRVGFLSAVQIRLDGRSRFELTDDAEFNDSLQHPKNLLSHVLQDDRCRQAIQEIVHDVFGLFFVIDPSRGGILRLRLATTPQSHELSLNTAARDFYRRAIPLKEMSDGVQAFIGLIIALRSATFKVILMDEPEAFLHPPLARRLGFETARASKECEISVICATHSSDFLIGCLQASTDVRVVRLQYSKGKSRASIVNTEELRRLYTAPLFRSANVISSLFHDGVAICESDNDRAFYSEIYHRLAENNRGYPSVLFIAAQNMQTIPDLMAPLRRFGVPAAGLTDLDILNEGGSNWSNFLQAAGLPETQRNALGQERGELKKLFEKANTNKKPNENMKSGLDILSDGGDRAVEDLIERLSSYGIFPTRVGELENWLKGLGVRGKGTDWTVAMLKRLSETPSDGSDCTIAASDTSPDATISPSDGDVWDYIRSVVEWIANPSRKGTS